MKWLDGILRDLLLWLISNAREYFVLRYVETPFMLQQLKDVNSPAKKANFES